MLGERLAFGELVAAVQDLVHQPQHLPRVGGDGQDVVAEGAPSVPPAHLSQVAGQRSQGSVVEFRGVVEDQHVSRASLDLRHRVGQRLCHRAWGSIRRRYRMIMDPRTRPRTSRSRLEWTYSQTILPFGVN